MHDGKWRRGRDETATLKQWEEKKVGDKLQNVWLWGGEFSRLQIISRAVRVGGWGGNTIAERRSRYLEVFWFVGRTRRCLELTWRSAFTHAHTNMLARQTPEPTHKNNWRLRICFQDVSKISSPVFQRNEKLKLTTWCNTLVGPGAASWSGLEFKDCIL